MTTQEEMRERRNARNRAWAKAHPERDAARSRRKRAVRAKCTQSAVRSTKSELAALRMENDLGDWVRRGVARPRVRGDCERGERPCPWVSCSHHLYLDVNLRTGSIKLNFPDLEPWELAETCSLDVADGVPATLERTGELMNITRERVRQIEISTTGKIRRLHLQILREHVA